MRKPLQFNHLNHFVPNVIQMGHIVAVDNLPSPCYRSLQETVLPERVDEKGTR